MRPSTFNFVLAGYTCDILQNAIDRYKQIIVVQLRRVRYLDDSTYSHKWRSVPEYYGHLDSLKVDLKKTCEKMPYLEMDESCKKLIIF